ncbi:hypothetical protein V1525DRAFT_413105 [Lipomyces kononenkoae]|uniref:Uncharacterized protein n=1 Tax=Lipomyces kononenkoae TaxID=34357 RepID=A0ACC3SUI9_LIPKO
MVDALANYIVNRYPALAGLYRMFEPVVVGLMLGGAFVCPWDQLSSSLTALTEVEIHYQCKSETWHIFKSRLCLHTLALA